MNTPKLFRLCPMANVLGLALTLLCFSLFLFQLNAVGDEPSNKEKSEIRRINALVSKAGRLFKAKNYDASLESISRAQQRMEKIAVNADQELLDLLKPDFARIERAHELLTAAGETPSELKPLPQPVSGEKKMVSFKDQVAPFLVARCGRCHINRSRGDFSAASYEALGQSTMVAVGIPNDSRIIQVIEDEEMPPGGSVEPSELEMLKSWIAQGANFDGDNPATRLSQLAPSSGPPRAPMNIAPPTGKETVSFGLHVAPILIDNCAECHIDTNNPRGNFNMRSFRQLVRGGDSGNPVSPGSSMNSLLMERLTAANGSNIMPPTGKLDAEALELIRLWIDEGATFDGGEPGVELRVIAAKRKADSQSHAELKSDRLKQSEDNWNLAMPDFVPDVYETDNFNLFGTNGVDELESLGKIAEELAPKILSSLKLETQGPFLKGNATIFVFQRHYDFSEFGTMIVRHSLPKEVNGYWGFTTIDAFASLLLKRGEQPADVQVSLAQQLAAIKVASLAPDVPRWFADGIGYWVAASSFPRDVTTKNWDNQAATIVSNMQNPGDFLEGKLPEHQAALVAYAFVKQLRSDPGRFKALLKMLRDGQSFEQSFRLVYGATPEAMFGLTGKSNRTRRRNR